MKRAYRLLASARDSSDNGCVRCAQHDLAAGPDGQCALCHRERRSAPAPAPSPNAARVVYIGGAIVLLTTFAIGVSYRAIRDRAIVADAESAMATSSTAAAQAAPVTSGAPSRDLNRDLEEERRRQAALTDEARRKQAQLTDDERRKAEQKQQALASVKIVVYTTQWCGVCKHAKAWLNANGIPYEERDVESSPLWKNELQARNARGSIPTFDVEGQIAVGFSESGVLAMREQAAAKKMPR